MLLCGFTNNGPAKSIPVTSNGWGSVILSLANGAVHCWPGFTRVLRQIRQCWVVLLVRCLPFTVQYLSLTCISVSCNPQCSTSLCALSRTSWKNASFPHSITGCFCSEVQLLSWSRPPTRKTPDLSMKGFKLKMFEFLSNSFPFLKHSLGRRRLCQLCVKCYLLSFFFGVPFQHTALLFLRAIFSRRRCAAT